MLHVGTCDTGSQNSGMLVASRILGNSLVNDLCCLVTCVVCRHVFHVGMMEMEECGSTFNRDCLPVSSKPCIVDSRG